jgi:peptide/nickel transport system permease protein
VNAAPSSEFPLGADNLGRDRLSRLLEGARVSLLLAPAAAAVAVLLAA